MPDPKRVPNYEAKKAEEKPSLEEVIQRLDGISSALEATELGADAEIRKSDLADRWQRRWIRWIAIAVGVLVIIGLSSLLYHLTHNVFNGTSGSLPASVLVAVFVAPIISITTITVFLFLGAFRRFKDNDLDKLPTTAVIREVGRSFSS